MPKCDFNNIAKFITLFGKLQSAVVEALLLPCSSNISTVKSSFHFNANSDDLHIAANLKFQLIQ